MTLLVRTAITTNFRVQLKRGALACKNISEAPSFWFSSDVFFLTIFIDGESNLWLPFASY